MAEEQPKTVETRVNELEAKLNDVASKLNAKADAHADNFVAGLAKKMIDSRFTWAIVSAIATGSAMLFFICV